MCFLPSSHFSLYLLVFVTKIQSGLNTHTHINLTSLNKTVHGKKEKERREEAKKESGRRGRLQQAGNKAGVVGFTGSTGRGEQLELPQQTSVNLNPMEVCV